MAEDLRAPGHEDSIGDFKAGADGDSTLPPAAKITSTRLGLVCFICLIKLYHGTGKFFRRALAILEESTSQLYHQATLS
jgi:hypothetical protein